MRKSALLYVLVGLLVAVILVAAATNLALGASADTHDWLRIQSRTPLLWMVDGCAVILWMGFSLFGITLSGMQDQIRSQADETDRQLALLAEQTAEAIRLNAERAVDLEAEAAARQATFDEEARRLTEQILTAVNAPMENQARRLEALHMAMQYQRAELRQMRGSLRTGQIPASESEGADPFPLEIEAANNRALPPYPPAVAPADTEPVAEPVVEPIVEAENSGLMDHTVNAGSTLILETLEFEVPMEASDEQSEEAAVEASSETALEAPVEASSETVTETPTERSEPTDSETPAPSVASTTPPVAEAVIEAAPVVSETEAERADSVRFPWQKRA